MSNNNVAGLPGGTLGAGTVGPSSGLGLGGGIPGRGVITTGGGPDGGLGTGGIPGSGIGTGGGPGSFGPASTGGTKQK